MRIFRDGFRGPKRKRILIPLLISIILHILILMLFLHKDLLEEDRKIAEKNKKNYIEISEIPVPKEKETEPPEKPRVLADRSHKAEEEKTIDDSTRLTKPAQQPRSSEPDTEKDKTAKRSEDTDIKQKAVKEKVEKKDTRKEKQQVETAGKETEGIKKQQPKEQKKEDTTDKKIASVPKESPQKKPEKKEKDLSEIGKKLLRSSPSPKSTPDATPSEKKPLYGTNAPKKEDTVELSTKEFKYISYFTSLKRKIDGVWNYPEESQIRGETGRLFLEFTLNSNGDLEEIQLLNSSGYTRLDKEAIRAIRVASPYNPFPESWNLERLNIRASFEYRYSRFIR